MIVRRVITILGSGASSGVPRIGNDWGVADPANPKNRRTRCSILIEQFAPGVEQPTRVLIDSAPDMRAQLLAAGVGVVDAVLYTHDHADQVNGIDDLKAIAQNRGSRVPCYMNAATRATLTTRFAYCFQQASDGNYKPVLEALDLPEYGTPLTISGAGGDISFIPLRQFHGSIESVGFRFGGVSYNNDVVDFPPESLAALSGLDVWIVDALRYRVHATHAHVEKTLGWIDQLQPLRAYLINMNGEIDHDTLQAELPPHVMVSFDGLRFEVEHEL